MQAEAGSCAITGTAEAPAKPGVPLADIGTGTVAANAVLAALLARGRTGRGTAVSVAMFDVVTDWMSWALHQVRATGTDPPRLGLSSPMVAPYGAFRTCDGQTIVLGTTNDGEWRRLAGQMLGRPDLADDARYAGNPARVRDREDLDAVIAQWVGARTFAEASAAAESARIGWARLNTPTEVLDHPQLAERDRWVRTTTAGGTFLSLRPSADAPDWEWVSGAVPSLGEHTSAVLNELGLG